MTEPRQPDTALTAAYIVRQHINRGRIHDVYSVWSIERDCLCIAKVMRPDCLDNAAERGRLIRGGRFLTGGTHPHLVRGYELVTADDDVGPMVITETLTGATLSRLIQDSRPDGLGPEDAVQLGRQLCAVLHYLHRHELIHMDLKPSNIVCSGGRAVLLDIDLAQAPGPCRAGAGTTEYMAPEQLIGGPMSQATDIWGLGAVLYRTLTRHRPFPGTREARLRAGHAADLTRLDRPDINPGFSRLIAACLTAEPEGRPSLDEVRQTLDALIADMPHPGRDGPGHCPSAGAASLA